ncbi:MAG: hypothetical protein LBN30_02790 [Oscillospiraceae bacterium]|jgi:hypothetical protein|nr:hypothetical protein [Oscillospiraceae bacterium]
MSLKDFNPISKSFTSYARSNSYELVGKPLDLTFDSGRKTTLSLARVPLENGISLQVTLSDGLNDFPAECLKLRENFYLVNFAIQNFGATYILDFERGLATHVVVGGDAPMADYGYIDGAAADTSERHALSDDLDGNTVDWTFSPYLTARVKYGKDSLSVSFPNAGAMPMPPFEINGFAAIRLAEGLYFQYGQVSFGGLKVGLFLASDFFSVLFDGDLFGVPGLPPLGTVGGYGQIIADK